jgi:hypothetical protein
VEAFWLPPGASTLVGVFRSSTSPPISAAGSLPKRAVEFPLVRTARSALYFDGLTYRRTPEGIESWVIIGLGDGGTRPERFLYAPLAP